MESLEEFGIKKILVAVDTSDYSEMVIARASAIAAVPSGASTGVHETLELREGEIGMGEKASSMPSGTSMRSLLHPKFLKYMDVAAQREIDEPMIQLGRHPK
jgi:enolase